MLIKQVRRDNFVDYEDIPVSGTFRIPNFPDCFFMKLDNARAWCIEGGQISATPLNPNVQVIEVAVTVEVEDVEPE